MCSGRELTSLPERRPDISSRCLSNGSSDLGPAGTASALADRRLNDPPENRTSQRMGRPLTLSRGYTNGLLEIPDRGVFQNESSDPLPNECQNGIVLILGCVLPPSSLDPRCHLRRWGFHLIFLGYDILACLSRGTPQLKCRWLRSRFSRGLYLPQVIRAPEDRLPAHSVWR
jgi:hypothetical protein